MKTRTWYSTQTAKPTRRHGLIIKTDMGYIFEAMYQDNKFLVSVVRDNKVYFEPFNQDSITHFMIV